VNEPTIEEIAARVGRLADESNRRLSIDLASRLDPPSRLDSSGAPAAPIVGFTPFDVATVISAGVIDWSTLAASLVTTNPGAPHDGIAGSAGVATSLNRSDHAHPAQVSLFAGVTGSANFTVRQGLLADTFGRLSLDLDVSDRASITLGGGSAARDFRLVRTAVSEITIDNGAGGPATTKHVGPLFIEGPTSMDLAVTYDAPGKPNGVTRTDGALISTTVINYSGAQVASVVTTRFGKTITVTPTYTGADITAIHRAVA
jgi:hypothetical protein